MQSIYELSHKALKNGHPYGKRRINVLCTAEAWVHTAELVGPKIGEYKMLPECSSSSTVTLKVQEIA